MFAYLYFRTNSWLEMNKICKQGFTKRNPFCRNIEYITYEFKQGHFLVIIAVSVHIVEALDTTIKKYFDHLNARLISDEYNGGTEYFSVDIIDKVIEYLSINKVKHHVLTNEEIDELYKKFLARERITKLNKKTIMKLLNNSLGNIIPNKLQLDVCPKLLNYYKNNDKGKLIWACGCGKTKMSILALKGLNAKKIVIGVPSKQLQLQFLDSLLDANIKPENILFVGSVKSKKCNTYNNRDNITEFYNTQRDITIIIVTYKSSYLLNHLSFDFKIADEAHHLVGKIDAENERRNIIFHNITATKSLFMTATEKVTDLDSIMSYSMNNEHFGDCIDKRTFKWAIENKKITDYNLLVIRDTITDIEKLANSLNICSDNYELFISAYMVLKSLNTYCDLTHIVLYTNTIENATIVKNYIDDILSKSIFNFTDVYNKDLHTDNNIDLTSEVNEFSRSTIGIISSVYIFGEGFDLPKLNGVCFCENMNSEIRIVQCAFRPNRLYHDNPNKIAYVIMPYIDNGNWHEENNSFQKLRKVVSKLRNVDESIEQKIKLCTIKKVSKNKYNLSNIKNMTFINNPDELHKIKIRLRRSTSLICDNIWKEEYKYLQILNKQHNIKSKKQYLSMENEYDFFISDVEKYFNSKGLWNGWYDFICVDTSIFIQSKDEWKIFCKSLNIKTLNDYKEKCLEYECLPIDPGNFYINFTSVVNELVDYNNVYY